MKNNYFFLFRKYFRTNLKSVMNYDLDFIFGIIAMLLKAFVNFFIILLIFELIDDVKGWNYHEMLFLYSMTTISYGLWHCFFIDTVTIPTYVKSGEFDRFLLKPIDPLFQIMMESFDEDGWGELVFGLILIIISVINLKIITPFLLLLPLFWICGMLIYASLSIFFSSIAFYTVGCVDLTDNVSDFQEFAKYPLIVFNKGIRIIFSFVIPIAFTAFYPSLIFLRFDFFNILLSIITIPVSILFFFISWKFWHYSLRKYNSNGS